MSTAAQTVATKRPIASRVSAWKNLLGLLPYISRYKGRVTLGLLVLGAMGVVGNLLPLVLGPGIMYSATTLVTMVLAIALMLKLSLILTLWVLLPVPVVVVAVSHFGKVIHDLYETIQAALASLSARVQENLTGVRVVRAYRQEEAEIRAFDAPNREYVARNIRLIRTWSMFMPSLTALLGEGMNMLQV